MKIIFMTVTTDMRETLRRVDLKRIFARAFSHFLRKTFTFLVYTSIKSFLFFEYDTYTYSNSPTQCFWLTIMAKSMGELLILFL